MEEAPNLKGHLSLSFGRQAFQSAFASRRVASLHTAPRCPRPADTGVGVADREWAELTPKWAWPEGVGVAEWQLGAGGGSSVLRWNGRVGRLALPSEASWGGDVPGAQPLSPGVQAPVPELQVLFLGRINRLGRGCSSGAS